MLFRKKCSPLLLYETSKTHVTAFFFSRQQQSSVRIKTTLDLLRKMIKYKILLQKFGANLPNLIGFYKWLLCKVDVNVPYGQYICVLYLFYKMLAVV